MKYNNGKTKSVIPPRLIAIYAIVSEENEAIYYIGGTRNYSGRMAIHIAQLRNNHHPNKALQRAWNKYGEESFRFTILIKYEADNVTAQQIADAESAFLKVTGECNAYRKSGAGAFDPERGRKISEAKLTLSETEIKEVKALLLAGERQEKIGQIIGVGQSVVSKIKSGFYDKFLEGNN